MEESSNHSELAITGRETEDHTVPADVLLRTLDHLQRIVYLIAAAEEKRPIQDRVSLPQAFKQRNSLRCGVPKESSYAIPLSFPRAYPRFEASDEPSALDRTFQILQSAASGAWKELEQAVTDRRYLSRVLVELEAMLPRPGDRWGFSLTSGKRRVEVDSRTYRAVRDYISPEIVEDTVMTITGDLVRVDLAARKVTIRYGPTGREIPCFCEESAMASILENWSEPIQVTGRFTLDRGGHPVRLTNVTRVSPVDLSLFTFDDVDWLGRRLMITPPLVLQPALDQESGQLYVLVDHGLGIHVFAQTREEVADELAEQLLFQWDAYAMEAADNLSSGARWLRNNLLARMTEVDLATRSQGR